MADGIDFGINLATSADSWKVVRRAEELGYARAWFYDTQLLNADVFVAMAAAALQTSTIRLATGVLIPSNRIAPVAASALASLNALRPLFAGRRSSDESGEELLEREFRRGAKHETAQPAARDPVTLGESHPLPEIAPGA